MEDMLVGAAMVLVWMLCFYVGTLIYKAGRK